MRAIVATLSLLAACGFEAGPPTGGTGDDGPMIDARGADAGPCVGSDGDGDGVNDVCDPCPLDNPDDPDGDGVCTSVDRCLTGDDAVDADSDTIPDACDSWPCGAAPAQPPATVTWMTGTENVTLSTIDVAGSGRQVVASPGATLTVSATYSIVDCQCTGCIDQIEIGLIPGGKHACLYNGNPQGSSVSACGTPTLGAAIRTVTAPTTSGIYALRFNRGNDSSCQANGTWWDNTPPAAGNTFAVLCVR